MLFLRHSPFIAFNCAVPVLSMILSVSVGMTWNLICWYALSLWWLTPLHAGVDLIPFIFLRTDLVWRITSISFCLNDSKRPNVQCTRTVTGPYAFLGHSSYYYPNIAQFLQNTWLSYFITFPYFSAKESLVSVLMT